MAVPDRNWRQRLSRTITVEDAKSPRNQGMRAVGRPGQAAERASSWLWIKREEKSWQLTTDP
ncbi:hypothetical protein DPMN_029712 [Dreissena polymorpha]|uniref:Uncharacterized protein n=1 Tax=Dreissena polymorpha TaxID=45954 RepID=A0A9D4LWX5_DREPO|nr:hypothetical protein DPMN_023342 [Dreissena polymorpha]KAH3866615.1 hypothetical protein DPMN_029712 [Dreissena polymorpha]